MKHIKELANPNQILQGSQEKSKPISPLNEKIINRVFAVLMVKYTHKWASAFPDEAFIDEAKKVWGADLKGLDNMQIKQGLDTVIDHYPSWPPTVGEFKELCKVGEESRRLEQLSLPDKSKQAITSDERKQIIDKHSKNLHLALKGEYTGD